MKRKLSRPRPYLIAATALAVGAMAAGCGSASSSGGQKHPTTITIGATLPLTGPGAPYGQIFGDALKIAADRINSTGGVGGAKLQIVTLDDQALAAPAVMDATQLIKKDGAVLIATAYNDPPLAQYKIGERYGVPIVNGGGNDPALANKPYLWTDASVFTDELKPMFEYAKAHGVKKIGLLAATDFTNYDISVFHQLANQIFGGNQPLVTFDPASTSVTTQLQQLQSAGVDAISPLASGTLALTVAKDMSQLGMHERIVGKADTFTPASVVTQPAWNRAWGAITDESPPPWLNQAVEAHEHTPANSYHVFFANIAYMVASAVKILESEGKPISGKNINALFEEYAQSGKSLQGANGPVVFKPNHIVAHAYTIQENDSGTFKELQRVPVGA